ncbi:MAG: class I SAM-dependent methyltransferase [Candidatus Acidiferrum sp.]
MSFLNKLGLAVGVGTSREGSRTLPDERKASHGGRNSVATGTPHAPEVQGTNRISNGLKEFLWNLDGLGHGTLLDLGPAWQTTLSFFIERGFRVSSEDVLRGWSDFSAEEELRTKEAKTVEEFAERTAEAKAKRFLKDNLQYPAGSFDALLLWDVLDYLEPALAKIVVAHLTDLLRPGAVVFAMFHSKKPEGFNRYRVADTNTLQVLASKPICSAQKVYQNREIQDLFGKYRTMKSFVARDQLRETLFLK